jgi:hypothetical protein
VKGTRCVAAGIGTHEMVAGHITAGEQRWLVEKLVPGDGWQTKKRLPDNLLYVVINKIFKSFRSLLTHHIMIKNR